MKYEVRYHVKNQNSKNWHTFATFDSELEAYKFLVKRLEEKFIEGYFEDEDQFGIFAIWVEELYITKAV